MIWPLNYFSFRKQLALYQEQSSKLILKDLEFCLKINPSITPIEKKRLKDSIKLIEKSESLINTKTRYTDKMEKILEQFREEN